MKTKSGKGQPPRESGPKNKPQKSKKKTSYYEDPIPQTPHSASRKSQRATPDDYSDSDNNSDNDDLQEPTPIPAKKKNPAPSKTAAMPNVNDEVNPSTKSQLSSQVAPGNAADKKEEHRLYKNRKRLRKRMNLNPENGAIKDQVRDIRADMRMLCLRRGYRLDRNFEAFRDTKMFQLIRNVTPDMAKLHGEWWTQELVRDLIHAICIDKIRNKNALAKRKLERERKKAAAANMAATTPKQDKLPLSMKRAAIIDKPASVQPHATVHEQADNNDGDDEDENSYSGDGGEEEGYGVDQDDDDEEGGDEENLDTYNDPRQFLISQKAATAIDSVRARVADISRSPVRQNPVTPIHMRADKPNHNQLPNVVLTATRTETGVLPTESVPNSVAAYELCTTTETSPSSTMSPLAGKGSTAKGGSQSTQIHQNTVLRELQKPEELTVSIPETQPRPLPNRSPPPSQTHGNDTPAYIPIRMIGFSPTYVPTNITYEEFERRIAQRVEIPDDKFLVYLPNEAGPGRKWLTVGVQSAWVKLVRICGEAGATVRVVDESWFDEDAADWVRTPPFVTEKTTNTIIGSGTGGYGYQCSRSSHFVS